MTMSPMSPSTTGMTPGAMMMIAPSATTVIMSWLANRNACASTNVRIRSRSATTRVATSPGSSRS